jgi:hypothetical protein
MIRDGGRMWNAKGELQDTIAMVPDRGYATMYSVILEDAKRNGQFDPATMGNVANVGLMAQKAEEYGSHDKHSWPRGRGRSASSTPPEPPFWSGRSSPATSSERVRRRTPPSRTG